MVGIHGIAGIGKTTIAKAVYNSIANQFDSSCFLGEVRENSRKNGLAQLQETIFSNLLGENNIKCSNVSQGIPILEKRFRFKKILLILDDVDDFRQVKSLAGRKDWFGQGSRIIITTRNEHFLRQHGVEILHEVKGLEDDESLELFSWNAFKKSEPDPSYAEIAKHVVKYAQGLPLALNVIGSDLFGKTIQEWKLVLMKYGIGILEEESPRVGNGFCTGIPLVQNSRVSRVLKLLANNNFRLLEWNEHQSLSLPTEHYPEILPVLNAPHCHITNLVDLSDSGSITRIPDVSTALLTSKCPTLAEIFDQFIGNLGALLIENCLKLERLQPAGMSSASLEPLNLGKRSNLPSFSNELAEKEDMKHAGTQGTSIKVFHNSITKIDGFQELVLKSSAEDPHIHTDMFHNTEEDNVEECSSGPKLLGKIVMMYWTNWAPKLNKLVLENCDLSDNDLELFLSSFLKLKWLILSNNNFVTIHECIKELANLLFLCVKNCKQLRYVSVLPPYLQHIDARNCISLTQDSFDVILSQAFQEVENMDIVVWRKRIPKWFDYCGRGGSVGFWVRREFPGIAAFLVLGGQTEVETNFTCEFTLTINDIQVLKGERTLPRDHVWLFDLRIHLTAKERHYINKHLHRSWNHVGISCTAKNNHPHNSIVRFSGIHLSKDRMNIHDVSFISPDLRGSDIARHKMENNDADIYEVSGGHAAFDQASAELVDKKIVSLMEGSSRADDEDEEEYLTGTENEDPERRDVVVKDRGKGTVKYSDLAEEEQNKDFFIESATGKLEKSKLEQESTSFAYASKNNGTSNIKNPEKIGFTRTKGNPEAGESHMHIPESRAFLQLESKDAGDSLISMEAFYASLEAELATLSDPEDSQVNTVSGEGTQEALQILRGFVSEKFSLLLQPEQSKLMKNNLEYLLSLTSKDGISLRMRSVISQISRSFTEWFVDYNDASFKLESAAVEMSKVGELKEGVEGNVREFREVEESENEIWKQLEYLKRRGRELEAEINGVKAKIADFTSERENVAKRKRKLYENGRMLKAKRDDLWVRLPRLISEEQSAKIIQTNIEEEWYKLGLQFIHGSSFEYGN